MIVLNFKFKYGGKLNEVILFKSYIIFSERCELKEINLDSTDIKVIKRNDLIPTLKDDIDNSAPVLKADGIVSMYTKLKQYSNVDEAVEKKHIEDIA